MVRKSKLSFDTNRSRVSRRAIPRSIHPILENPEAWKLYGHYNKLSLIQLQNEIRNYKDIMEYECEYEFLTELWMKKKCNLPVTPL